MKTTISLYDFRGAFMGSDTYKHNFSHKGLGCLFSYLEQREQDTGQELDFDMVEICCSFCEYADWQEFAEDYSWLVERDELETMEDLRDYTTVIPTAADGFIIQAF